MEFPPCDALKPYIRCFWGSRTAITGTKCGLATPEPVKNPNTYFIFGIRFYPWSVSMFAEDSMRNTKNAFFDAGYHFSGIKKEITKRLFGIQTIYQLIPIAERILLHHFHDKFTNNIVLLAMSKIVTTKGNLRITDLKEEVLMSNRQLERLFLEYVGIPPKSLAAMVRYQYMWNDFVFHQDLPMIDAVYKYGYSNQAHLCRDFKKYHSMNISEARKYALPNVGNIQDETCEL